jgi:hypothetical protein
MSDNAPVVTVEAVPPVPVTRRVLLRPSISRDLVRRFTSRKLLVAVAAALFFVQNHQWTAATIVTAVYLAVQAYLDSTE